MGIFPLIPFLYATVYNLGHPAEPAEIQEKLIFSDIKSEYFLRKKFFHRTYIKQKLGFLSYFFHLTDSFFLKITIWLDYTYPTRIVCV